MAKLTTTNFEAGETTDSAATNTKFSAVATATATINEDNVRSEGIDKRQLENYAHSTGRMEPMVYADYTTNALTSIPTFDYTGKTGIADFPITHGDNLLLDWSALAGGGITIKAGDLVRIHFNILLDKINDVDYGTYGPAGNNTNDRQHNRPDPIGVIFFPKWQINGSGSWVVLPNEAHWDATLVAPADIAIENSSTLKSESIAFCSMEGFPDSGDCNSNRSVHGSWAYIHTGADIVLNKLRLHARGPMVYWMTGANRVFRAMSWGTGRYGAGYLEIPGTGTNFTITLTTGGLGIMVMRGDS